MRFEPTHEQATITDVVRSIVKDWAPQPVDESETAITDIESALSEGGWTGIGIPEQFGGSGFGLYEAMLAIEELGAVLLPTPLRSTISARRALLAGLGNPTESMYTRCSDLLSQLASRGCGAVGLAGTKSLLADAPDCETVILFQDGLATAGTSADFGLKAARSLDMTRSHACLSRDAKQTPPLLDENAAARGLAEARALLAAELIGVARSALEQSVAYAREREAFGKPIGSFQAVGHRLADSARFVDGARVMCHCAGWHADNDSTELFHFSRIALLNAQRAVTHATDAAIQVHGAFGFTWEAGLHWYQRRAHAAAHLLGEGKRLRHELAQELAQENFELR